jgi:hypothetical protein
MIRMLYKNHPEGGAFAFDAFRIDANPIVAEQ